MILYYKKETSKEEIGQPQTLQETYALIDKHLKEIMFISHYKNIRRDKKDRYIIDFGSYTEFFVLEGKCEELESKL